MIHQEEYRKLKERINLEELINDSSIDQVLAFDNEMKIISWNRTCEIIKGKTRHEVIGKNVMAICPEMENENLKNAIENALKGYKSFVPHEKGPHGKGYYENHFIPLKENNRIIGVLNIIHDVAHRIKAENELKSLNKSLARKNKELKQKNAELSSLSQVTGHDLKEPLGRIYTFMEIILDEEKDRLSDKAKNYFKRFQASIQRLRLLADDIMLLSSISAEQQHKEEINLNHILKYVKANLSQVIESTNTEIKSVDLPSINGYRAMISQLFQNLIDNAMKFQPAGQKPVVTITWKMVKGDELKSLDANPETEYYCISIDDNGIGFERNEGKIIFNMFSRLHPTEYAGTGIGLAICRKIAELHNGFIMAESTVNEGSCFSILFPATN
jgi:PAS domain S-box-containing protein